MIEPERDSRQSGTLYGNPVGPRDSPPGLTVTGSGTRFGQTKKEGGAKSQGERVIN